VSALWGKSRALDRGQARVVQRSSGLLLPGMREDRRREFPLAVNCRQSHLARAIKKAYAMHGLLPPLIVMTLARANPDTREPGLQVIPTIF